MSNVIEFKRPSGRKKQKVPEGRIFLWFKNTTTSFKKNLFIYFKSYCFGCLVFVSFLSRKLLKLIITMSMVLFLVEWFMGRLGVQEFYNLLFLNGFLFLINVVSTSCIKWIRGNV